MDPTGNDYRCTLTPREASDRIDADRALARRVVSTQRLERRARIAFAELDGTRGLVEAFVANEADCCGFFGFSVLEEGPTIVLEITAPADEMAQRLLDAAVEGFEHGPDAAEVAGDLDGGHRG